MGVRFVRCLAVMALMALMPSLAHAQSSITGTIRDASGAVLPGVTVEAASPVLIEKVRSTVSDGTGGYRLTELLPGTYSLTFTLPGFATVKRDGVEITGAGVITINQDLKVGDLQETITVTGETPIVDVQSTRRQQVIDDSTINALPATRGYNALVFLVPSVTGGSNQIDLMPAMRIFYSHGGRGNEGRTYVDGLSTGSAFNGGGASGYIIDTANSQEMQVSLSGGLGETEVGGATVNFIPKTGGNSFAGQGFFSTAGEWSQGNNIDDHLRCYRSQPGRRALQELGCAGLGRRTDPPGQAVVLRQLPRLRLARRHPRDVRQPERRQRELVDVLPGSEPEGPQRGVENGHCRPSDCAGDAAQQGRVLLRQPARVRRLVADHGRRTDCRPRGDNWVASGTTSHRARGRQRRAGHRRWRVRLRRLVAARHAGDLELAGHQPAAARSRRLDLHQQVGMDGAAGRDSESESGSGAGGAERRLRRRHTMEHAGQSHLPRARLELQQHAEPDDVEGRGLLCHRCAQHEDRVRRGATTARTA